MTEVTRSYAGCTHKLCQLGRLRDLAIVRALKLYDTIVRVELKRFNMNEVSTSRKLRRASGNAIHIVFRENKKGVRNLTEIHYFYSMMQSLGQSF